MSHKAVRILIIDDDSSLRNMLTIVLKKEGFHVTSTENGISALKMLKNKSFDLIFSDIKMPDINGIDLLKKIKSHSSEIPVIMITAYASTDDAVEAMKLGAEDYLTKPFNLDEMKIIIDKVLSRKKVEQENVLLKTKLSEKEEYENIIGRSRRMQGIFDVIRSIAQTDSTVLISGESGTGKELIAKAIHRKSQRKGKEFVSINCGALPETLLESELFGHAKGAFTDAYKDKKGLFKMADHGTLFLDEISEMSQNMQVKLLRAIQEKRIRPVGGQEEIPVDVRIISASNRDLQASIKNNEFRSDLYYRLNVIPIQIPPLRERSDDIPLMMKHFLGIYNEKFEKNIDGFDQKAYDLFLNYHWPGNVRELENLIERAVALEKGGTIGIQSLPREMIYSYTDEEKNQGDLVDMIQEESFNYSEYVDDISRNILVKSLEINQFNIKKTAEMLKLPYRSLRHLMEKYNLKK